jgi:hypothetical protein
MAAPFRIAPGDSAPGKDVQAVRSLELADELTVALGRALWTAVRRREEIGFGLLCGDQLSDRHFDMASGTRHLRCAIQQPDEIGLLGHGGPKQNPDRQKT